MYINQLFKEKDVVFSFEIFPPKPTSPIENIYKTLEGLKDSKPDYISVTYGAGGSVSNNRTCHISSLIKNKYGIEALAHLTCISSTKDEVGQILEELRSNGVKNVLALRGDLPEGQTTVGELKNSVELIEYIKETEKFAIAAASYPEGHIEGKNIDLDVEVLKLKEEAGADYSISQLFFDNNYFYDYLNKAEQKGCKNTNTSRYYACN